MAILLLIIFGLIALILGVMSASDGDNEVYSSSYLYQNNSHYTPKQNSKLKAILKKLFNIFSFGFILTLITTIVVMFTANLFYVDQPPEKINIIALKDNQNISGRIYYRSGYIEETLYYYVMYNSTIGITTAKYRADMTGITESDETQPHIEIYRRKIENKFIIWFFGGVFRPIDNYYKIYVPEGTIDNQYLIDLE